MSKKESYFSYVERLNKEAKARWESMTPEERKKYLEDYFRSIDSKGADFVLTANTS